jgi:hypothetical protein
MDSSQTASSQTASSLADAVDARPHSSSPPASNEFDIIIQELEDMYASEVARNSVCSVEVCSVARFPEWESFTLFFFCEKGVEQKVSAHPLFYGRIAVPILTREQPTTTTSPTTDPSALDLVALWDKYELRYVNEWSSDHLRTCLKECLSIWLVVVQSSLQRTSYSPNEMIGTLVLRRTIARCVSFYQSMVGIGSKSYDDDIGRDYKDISDFFRQWGDLISEQVRNPDTAESWSKALEAVGY